MFRKAEEKTVVPNPSVKTQGGSVRDLDRTESLPKDVTPECSYQGSSHSFRLDSR